MTLIKRIVPAPLLSAAIFALWLMLARSTHIAQIAIGLGLALVVPVLTSTLRITKVRVRRPLVILRYILQVGADVLRSNLEIATDLIRWRWRRPNAGFVIVPLELRDPVGLAALSMVTTVVPGTVWSELALDRSALLLHVWNVKEEASFIAYFKTRYEAPLREIFE